MICLSWAASRCVINIWHRCAQGVRRSMAQKTWPWSLETALEENLSTRSFYSGHRSSLFRVHVLPQHLWFSITSYYFHKSGLCLLDTTKFRAQRFMNHHFHVSAKGPSFSDECPPSIQPFSRRTYLDWIRCPDRSATMIRWFGIYGWDALSLLLSSEYFVSKATQSYNSSLPGRLDLKLGFGLLIRNEIAEPRNKEEGKCKEFKRFHGCINHVRCIWTRLRLLSFPWTCVGGLSNKPRGWPQKQARGWLSRAFQHLDTRLGWVLSVLSDVASCNHYRYMTIQPIPSQWRTLFISRSLLVTSSGGASGIIIKNKWKAQKRH